MRKKLGRKPLRAPARLVTEFSPFSLMQFKLLLSVVAVIVAHNNTETNIKNPFVSRLIEGHIISLEEFAFY